MPVKMRRKDRYNSLIQWYFYPHNWLWCWAMIGVESSFSARAVSPVGARGLMQVMPATWYGIPRAKWFNDYDGFEVERNIGKGVREWIRNWNVFRNPQGADRYRIVTAAYNAGTRHLISAQLLAEKDGGSEQLWGDVAKHLHHVTGQRATETLNHVKRVETAFLDAGGEIKELGNGKGRVENITSK